MMTSTRRETLAHGVVAGLIGYAVVALFISLEDVMHGRPFFATAAQLGSWLVGRGAVAPAIPLDPAPVIAFNGVHLLLTMSAGMIASIMISLWDSHPRAGYPLMFAFIAAALATLLGSVAIVTGMLRTVAPSTVMTANVAAVIAVVVYLMSVHPALQVRYVEMSD